MSWNAEHDVMNLAAQPVYHIPGRIAHRDAVRCDSKHRCESGKEMDMRYPKLFAVMALGILAVAVTESAGAQTKVRVGVTFDASTRPDSAALSAAVRSGIEDGGTLRVTDAVAGARYVVNANFTTRGAKVFVDMRVIDAVTGNVVSRTTTSAPPAEIAGATTTLARGAAAKVAK